MFAYRLQTLLFFLFFFTMPIKLESPPLSVSLFTFSIQQCVPSVSVHFSPPPPQYSTSLNNIHGSLTAPQLESLLCVHYPII